MTRRYTAVHETGHAFPWFHGGAPLNRIRIFPQPLMGDDEWEGETDPGDVSDIDGTYAIMAGYAGPLAEAKLRAEDHAAAPVLFECSNPENDFINGQPTNPQNGTTRISFVLADTGESISQDLLLASFHSDVSQTYNLANKCGRTDVLHPYCVNTRELLDMPAVWQTIKRFALHLEEHNDIQSPAFKNTITELFEEETAIAAYDRWIGRGSPLWDDLADWFAAQGYA